MIHRITFDGENKKHSIAFVISWVARVYYRVCISGDN